MYTECSQFTSIINDVESVRSPHMFLLSTLYPTFYCGSSRTKVRLFLFFLPFFKVERKLRHPPHRGKRVDTYGFYPLNSRFPLFLSLAQIADM